MIINQYLFVLLYIDMVYIDYLNTYFNTIVNKKLLLTIDFYNLKYTIVIFGFFIQYWKTPSNE